MELITKEMYDLLNTQSVNGLQAFKNYIDDIINRKMNENEMELLMKEFELTKESPTLQNKVKFLVSKGKKVKALLLISQERKLSLRQAKEFLDNSSTFL